MNIRIVVADERQVNFFDTTALNSPLSAQGSMHNPTAGRKDQELETDREGRRFGTAGHRHGVDGERSAEKVAGLWKQALEPTEHVPCPLGDRPVAINLGWQRWQLD